MILIHAELTEPRRPVPIPVAARSKASVCRRLLAGLVGLNPAAGDMDVCLLSVVCCLGEVCATG